MGWLVDTDHEARFLRLCDAAAAWDPVFEDFRERPMMRVVVETVERDEANGYERLLKAHFGDFLETALPIARSLDAIGRRQPAPTMIRYLLRACDLGRRLGWIDGARIVEIGGGYGGLAAMICRLFEPASYAMVDHPAAQRLQAKFLSRAGVTDVIFPDSFQVVGELDLLISDFALCEMDEAQRQRYADHFFPRAARGALLWSEGSFPDQLTGEAIGAWLRANLPGRVLFHGGLRPREVPDPAVARWADFCWYWELE